MKSSRCRAFFVAIAWIAGSGSASAERPDRERVTRTTSARRGAHTAAQAPLPPPAPPDQLEDTGGTPPAGYHRAERIRPGLAITGVSMFATAYAPAAAIGFAAAGCEPGPKDYSDTCMFADDLAETLPYPVIGPILGVSRICEGESFCTAVLISDAVAQLAGVVLLVYGLQSRTVFERFYARQSPTRYAFSGRPVAGGGMIAIAGTF